MTKDVLHVLSFEVGWRQISELTGEIIAIERTISFGDDETTARREHAELLANGPRHWPEAHLMRDIHVGDLRQQRKFRRVDNNGRSRWVDDTNTPDVVLAAGGPVDPPPATQAALPVDAGART